jgi:hypothetical protein
VDVFPAVVRLLVSLQCVLAPPEAAEAV